MARKDRSSSRRAERGGGRPVKGRAAPPRSAASEGGPARSGVPKAAPARGDAAPVANLYGRNAVREALRGRRRVRRIWATKAAAREFAQAEIVDADEIMPRCGSDAHQGVCALAEPYPYADAVELLSRPVGGTT